LSTSTKRIAMLAVCVATAALTGCGRRGALDPAPDSILSTHKSGASTAAVPDRVNEDTTPGPHPRNVVPSKDPFILDPLL
jgi:predicted small lipoprotein YifL